MRLRPDESSIFARALAFGLCLALWAAQPARAADKTVGLIMPQDCSFGAEVKEQFSAALYAQGFNSREVDIFLQRPGTDKVSRLNSMRKFLAMGANALVVWGGTALKEVSLEAGKTPIVFVGAYDPVKDGLVASLEAPGRNITGVLGKSSMAFLMDNILECTQIQTMGVIYHGDVTDSVAQFDDIKAAATAKGVKIVAVDAVGKEPSAVMSALADQPFLYVAQGCAVENNFLPSLAAMNKPAATQNPGVKGAGIVFNLSPDPGEMVREAAVITARILKGEKTGAIPVVRPKKIDFVINLGEARRFDVKVPFNVMNRGTEVIK